MSGSLIIKEIPLNSRDLDHELLFEKSPEPIKYPGGDAGIIETSGSNLQTSKGDYAILLKAHKHENGFLLHEGNNLDDAKVTFSNFQPALSILLNLEDIEITADLLTALLRQPVKTKEEIIENLTAENNSAETYKAVLSALQANGTVDQSIQPALSSHQPATSLEGPKPEDNEEESDTEDEEDSLNIFEKIAKGTGSLFDSFMSKLESIGRETDISDEELGNEVWTSFFAQVQEMASPSLKQAEEMIAKSFKIDDQAGASRSLIACVQKGYVATCFQLLLFGEDPNQYQESIGTALHVAVKDSSEVMVKLLLAFNANPFIKNDENLMPIDLAERDTNIYKCLTDAASCHAKTKEYFDSHPKCPKQKNHGTYLMSLDGGGIRAFSICQFLIAVEDRMKQLSRKCSPIHSYFDYIAGTSSGAITGLVLLYTKHDVRTGRCLVYDIIKDVFDKNLQKREKLMNAYLQGIFKDTKMASIKGPQHAIITATLANQSPNKLHLMTSYERRVMDPIDRKEEGPKEREVWKAARITSAAPVYFPAVDNKFLDGGLMANNPTLAAMAEIIEQSTKKVEFGCVLSIGTGYCKDPKPVEDVSVFVPGVSLKSLTKIVTSAKGLFNLFDHFVKEVTQSDGHCIKVAESWCRSNSWPYYRWSPLLHGESGDIDPDCTCRMTIIDMIYHMQMDILAHPDKVDDVAKCILSKHK